MRQFVLPPEYSGGDVLVLTGDRARYLRKVLRLGPGDRFPGIDERGHRYELEIADADRARVRLRVRPANAASASGGAADGAVFLADVRPGTAASATGATNGITAPTGEPVRITLAQCLPKGPKMDQIVRQAVEAGVERIVPVLSSRSVATGDEGPGRLERWRRVAREAVQQSGSGAAPTVDAPVPLARLADALGPAADGELRLFLHELPLASATLHRYCTVPPRSVVLCVGPEGGLSSEETSLLEAAGWKPLWLGPTVLRAETAPIFAVGALRMILLERASWTPNA